MNLDRRTTLKAIGAAGVAGGLEAAPAMATALPPSVIVYSGRLPERAAFAEFAKASGTLLVDSAARDLGLAWREEIARHLALHPGPVEGYTLWSDLLISQGMGRDQGLKTLTETRHRGAFRWSLR